MNHALLFNLLKFQRQDFKRKTSAVIVLLLNTPICNTKLYSSYNLENKTSTNFKDKSVDSLCVKDESDLLFHHYNVTNCEDQQIGFY